MPDGKTIKQISDELGVSVQTVYRKLNAVKQDETDETNETKVFTKKINGITFITEEGEEFLKDALTPVKQSFNDVKRSESEIIAFLTAQIENLQEELRKEREHSRMQADRVAETIAEQSNRIADLAEQLAELTRNSQVLHKQEQDRHALPTAQLETGATDQPPEADGGNANETKKRPFWLWLFWKK